MSCVPCYRHTDKMIEKLESAGLGFYVKATETQQKLGELGMGKGLGDYNPSCCFSSRQNSFASARLQSVGATSQHAPSGV